MPGKKLMLGAILTVIALVLVTVVAVANAAGPVPPPYAGLKNPFPWDDTSVQRAGRQIYQRSCLACHGPDGASLRGSNFSSPDFPQKLEQDQDFYFWVVSEGALAQGMPGFKSSLSEEERWQILTFMWSLGKVAPPTTTPPALPPSGASLQLSAPSEAKAGQQLKFTATLLDKNGAPVPDTTVQFFIKVDFFTTGLMPIGEAVTDAQGVAVFDYTPRLSGDVQVVAQYQDTKGSSPLTLSAADEPFYQTEAGIRMPNVGGDVFYGPPSALQLGEMGQAPTGGFRLPGGILSWLWLFILVMALLYVTYFRVMYQVYRMPGVRQTNEVNTRLLPLSGLMFIVILGIILVATLFHGPYSHFHLVP